MGLSFASDLFTLFDGLIHLCFSAVHTHHCLHHNHVFAASHQTKAHDCFCARGSQTPLSHAIQRRVMRIVGCDIVQSCVCLGRELHEAAVLGIGQEEGECVV